MKRKTPWIKNCSLCGRFSTGGKPCKDGRCKPINQVIDNILKISAKNDRDFRRRQVGIPWADIRQQPHYNQYKIQPITFIVENKLTFCQGNAIKYLLRHNQKNGIEDLEKAKVYIDYMIEEIKTGTVKP